MTRRSGGCSWGGAACVLVLATAACGGSPTETVGDEVGTESGGGDSGEDSGDDAGGDEDSADSVGVGEPGTIGQWEVTVNGTETAATYGDEEFMQEEAQGEFVIVDMTVSNTGTEATTFDESGVTLIDGEGNSHSAGSMMSEDSLFLEQINPGNEASGDVVFDVPEGTEPASLEVEDMLSFEEPLVISLD
ncbi:MULTISPECIES: DUF4352 domain-containing protein [unclassified Nocardiopsis]|uniref:DUF4352 domain-containing protein n=1 Tax=Nocardiopsis TaxID=2013 RepID=UPI00387B96EC